MQPADWLRDWIGLFILLFCLFFFLKKIDGEWHKTKLVISTKEKLRLPIMGVHPINKETGEYEIVNGPICFQH